ncbi:MAG: bifunctional aspartate kinase/homoserine dehydrogenase I [Mucilaginibacter polytrichastri]|nr:bifunctional aspartate kinase/homoserine dehydrogenase I [Mucilaginibacter polytrichastri]
MNVVKFGGTSVGSVGSIRQVAGIVKNACEAGPYPVVVVSAMGGVTNQLINMAQDALAGKPVADGLAGFEKRHFAVVRELVPINHQNAIFTKLKVYFNELEDLLNGISILKELTPQTLDLLLSYGERCSAFMLSGILRELISSTIFCDAREFIKTDSHFGHARVDIAQTEKRVQEFYQQNQDKLMIVTGFIASNAEGRTTTLGRGGSDYTAAILGSALDAEEIEIWTDVDGMMTADPRIVKKAFSLEEITYTEAMELSYFGAKVIYPPTLTPAFQKRIPIVIKNTFNPAFPGTYIRHHSSPNKLPVRGISSIAQITLINLEGSGMIGQAGFSGRLFSLLAREQINVVMITQSSSEHSITFAVHPVDALRAKHLIDAEFELELLAGKLEPVNIEGDLSVLAIVGENMRKTPGISGKFFQALGRNGVNVRAMAQGSSEYNISVVIGAIDLAKALNAVHDEFFDILNKTVYLFCLGTGSIGTTLFEQLKTHAAFLAEHNGLNIKVAGICNTRKMLIDANGISLADWKNTIENAEEKADLKEFVRRMIELNLPNCICVDNTPSPNPVVFYEDIFRANISIATCNKLANSGDYEQYFRLKQTARKHQAKFMYETNVGAGLPIIRTLHDLMLSGDRIVKIEAILSGTLSYIFNIFRGEMSFHDAVKAAQENGYTEPDPRDDLRGTDFMRKMLILARDAGYPLQPKDVVIEPILPQNCTDASSVEDFYEQLKISDDVFSAMKTKAETEGKAIRYIGVLENGQASVKLEMVDSSHPFYSLSGSDNIIAFTTDRYHTRPLVVKGPGAGAEVTAAGVFADVIQIGSR